jgi:hypothetical protein
MSWQQFKDNVLRQVTPGVSDIDTVANIYATEYDNAIKRGYDKINSQKVRESTNIEGMKSMFKMALQRGQNSTEPYDLVGNMGDGVKAYWAGVIMNAGPEIPVTLPISATSNLSATLVSVTNFGEWKGDSSGGSPFKLTPQQIEESKAELKYYKKELKTANEEERKPIESIIALEEGKLENGEDVSSEFEDVIFGDETIDSGPPAKFNKGADWGPLTRGAASSTPYTPPTFTPNMALGEKIVTAARADVGVAMETEGQDNGPRVRQILSTVGITKPSSWCASAVTTWWKAAGAIPVPMNVGPAWVPNWMEWGKKNGQFSMQPAIGAAVIYDWKKPHPDTSSGMHIGIVSAINSDGSVITIEGNTRGKNGGGCYERKGQMGYVVGYVWPK